MSVLTKYIRNENNEFVCPHCNTIKKNQNTMYYHMLKHSDSLPHECSTCKKGFIQKASLELHILSKHSKDKNTLECPHKNCSFKSLTKGNRIMHYIRKHCSDEIKELMYEEYCNNCCESFNSSSAFFYHAIECIQITNKQKLEELNSIL